MQCLAPGRMGDAHVGLLIGLGGQRVSQPAGGTLSNLFWFVVGFDAFEVDDSPDLFEFSLE